MSFSKKVVVRIKDGFNWCVSFLNGPTEVTEKHEEAVIIKQFDRFGRITEMDAIPKEDYDRVKRITQIVGFVIGFLILLIFFLSWFLGWK